MKDTENTEPLVTNTDLGSAMDVYEKSLEEHTSHDVITRLNMTTAYGSGARTLRDIYESARSKDKERIAALEAAAQAVINRWDSPQWEWDKHGPTASLIADLRALLNQQPTPER